jgi:dGTPase
MAITLGLSVVIREILEEKEKLYLSKHAALSKNTKGRIVNEPKCPIRTDYQRDRDRIIHSRAFRQLKYKTQVFLMPFSSLRTRLTHTIEVAQIARTIAKALGLNEDLTEAIALAHDVGHPPFGHAGEEILDKLLSFGFKHNQQSLRIVEKIEKKGKGLNLTWEVREGILKHSVGKSSLINKISYDLPSTLEGCIIRFADVIAYINHDIQDALSSGIITDKDLPKEPIELLGRTHGERINTMVKDIIYQSWQKDKIEISEKVLLSMEVLRNFLYEKVYFHEKILKEVDKAKRVICELFEYYLKNTDVLYEKLGYQPTLDQDGIEHIICDYIVNLGDNEAILEYQKIFIPKPWFEEEKNYKSKSLKNFFIS